MVRQCLTREMALIGRAGQNLTEGDITQIGCKHTLVITFLVMMLSMVMLASDLQLYF
jgi:hypothetical protein